MSNHLAIATVTATLQRIIKAATQQDIAGASVTTVRPNASGSGTPETGVNLYLYQAAPNPAWRNADLRNRRPKGELIKQAQAGLDLYYIMTFYGNETQLEPQRLLGSAVRAVVDHPILTAELIEETIKDPAYNFLAGCTLDQQVDRVTIVPTMMDTEELSKIRSAFFQSQHGLSFAFQGGAVLIEGNKGSGRALPVRRIATYSTPNQPMISQVVSQAGTAEPIVATSSLMIRGTQLHNASATIKIGDAKLTPQQVTQQEIQLNLSSLPKAEVLPLRAGVQSLQVLHPTLKHPKLEPGSEYVFGSNVVPFVLCPTIQGVEIEQIEPDSDGLDCTQLRVEVDLMVGVKQRVLLFLNERSHDNPAAYILAARSRLEDSYFVSFPISDVKAGEYLVRVQIDGAESPLEVDTYPNSETNQQYIRPTVAIG
ncbi:hypothetical protein A6770_33625 [Nostoc minutum NIES-26]|uniref:Pvc16 N-terminal domain-containing protein n=1 Tax=Nostoc minutum NIES-26 TaxID=1844469 RepID=A0A367Q102_9NOSO|nr:hypothetical protein A6770_33625 [Nostoc minutum NIES-26]